MSTDRWPSWVYAEGEEPDFRFSLANERTFLAWLRTSLAIIAAGVALNVLDLRVLPEIENALSALLLLLGAVCPVVAFGRWASTERAMRQGDPLPSLGLMTAAATGALFLLATVLIIVVVTT